MEIDQKVTYREIRNGDRVKDKSGNVWHVSGYHAGQKDHVAMYLGANPGDQTHLITKPLDGEVTRVQALVGEAEVQHRIDEFDAIHGAPDGVPVTTHDEATKAVQEAGGAIVAEFTPAQEIAAQGATETAPVMVPGFDSMTPLEMRTHLYVLHGVWCEDVQTTAALEAHHADLHAGKVKSRTLPHEHHDGV